MTIRRAPAPTDATRRTIGEGEEMAKEKHAGTLGVQARILWSDLDDYLPALDGEIAAHVEVAMERIREAIGHLETAATLMVRRGVVD